MLPGESVRPCWDAQAAKVIIGFGKWIFLSSLIGFAASNGEKLLLGAALPAISFGVFSIAATLLAALTGLVSSLNAHLIFPSLSEALRDGPAVAATVYARVQRVADLFLGFVAGGLFMSGAWVVRLLYDARYVDAGWMLQLLGLGILAIRFQVLEQMMFARSEPAWVSASNALRALSLIVLIPLGNSMGGVYGAVVAVVASQFVGWPVALAFKHRAGLLTLRGELAWPVALLAGLAAGGILNYLLGLFFHHPTGPTAVQVSLRSMLILAS
jgi:O-antigen/teichoic acid export membrane protein